jgi:Rrf2 family protein
MKLITRDTDYALRAICFISARKDKMASAAELVKGLKMPQAFLRKLLQTLSKNAILKSYKGKGGGFLLRKKPKEIFLIDLIRIFQGPILLNECAFKGKLCPNVSRCILRNKIESIERGVIQELKGINIASLLKGRWHDEKKHY